MGVRPALRMPDQNPSFGHADLRVWQPGRRFSGPFGLAPDSTGQNQSSCLTDFRAPASASFGGADPRQRERWVANVSAATLRRGAASPGPASFERPRTRERGASTMQVVGPDVCDPSLTLRVMAPTNHSKDRSPESVSQDDRFWPVESETRSKGPEHPRRPCQTRRSARPNDSLGPWNPRPGRSATGVPRRTLQGEGSSPSQVPSARSFPFDHRTRRDHDVVVGPGVCDPSFSLSRLSTDR